MLWIHSLNTWFEPSSRASMTGSFLHNSRDPNRSIDLHNSCPHSWRPAGCVYKETNGGETHVLSKGDQLSDANSVDPSVLLKRDLALRRWIRKKQSLHFLLMEDLRSTVIRAVHHFWVSVFSNHPHELLVEFVGTRGKKNENGNFFVRWVTQAIM